MDTAARNALVLTWHPLVYRVARELWRSEAMRVRYGDMQDMIQTGCLGLLRAAEIYNASRGVSFQTYAYASIRGLILCAARDLTTIHIPGATQTAMRAGKDTPLTRAGEKALGRKYLRPTDDVTTCEPDQAEAERREEQEQQLAAAMARLHPGERETLCDSYGIGTPRLDDRHLAAKLGLSRQATNNRLQRLRARLREICHVG